MENRRAPSTPDCGVYLHRSLYHRAVAEREAEFVVNMLRPGRRRVLEVGPGTGRLTRHLAELAESLTVCDLRQETLDAVAERLREHRNIQYRVAPLERLEALAEYGQFDAAVAVRVVPHAEDWRRGLDRLVGAVRPGGLAIFDLWSRQSFVGALMRVLPRPEPVVVHRLTRREIRRAISRLPGQVVATYRWGYPRLGPLHLDDWGSFFFPSWAYATLFCMRKS